jgi:hypothetical protein
MSQMLADDTIDVVTSQVLVVSEDGMPVTFLNVSKRYPEYDLGLLRAVYFSDMMRFHDGRIVGSRNIPHNSPMWRKRIHSIVGPFAYNQTWQAGCLDYSLWLRALLRNRDICHMNEPLELFVPHMGTCHTSRPPIQGLNGKTNVIFFGSGSCTKVRAFEQRYCGSCLVSSETCAYL